jgi:hypothetical protein
MRLKQLRRCSASDVVRDAILSIDEESESPLRLIRHLVGVFAGPADLSVNKKYFKGFGE